VPLSAGIWRLGGEVFRGDLIPVEALGPGLDEVRVPPGAEEMETECRCEGAFSILGMLVKRRWKETGDDGRKENRLRRER
jgi:hypothetical protein